MQNLDHLVESLLRKGEQTKVPQEAVMYTQAACNAANALRVISDKNLTSPNE